MDEQRIIELEIKIAYQEDLLQALNNIVTQQQHQVMLLEKTCQYLHDRINSIASEKADKIIDQPPPHY